MLCDHCKQNEANVHITKIINNDKTTVHLCEECARQYQQEMGNFLQSNFSFPKFLGSLFEQAGFIPGDGPVIQKTLACPKCGTTSREISQYGKLGCVECYDTFSQSLTPIIKGVHGRETHIGKVPHRTGKDIRLKQEIFRLKEQLAALVAGEEFEEAAKVRDQIKALENKEG
ncbi:MAG: UvrB/UvrC motif-containing protein [Bacillota bacterium]